MYRAVLRSYRGTGTPRTNCFFMSRRHMACKPYLSPGSPQLNKFRATEYHKLLPYNIVIIAHRHGKHDAVIHRLSRTIATEYAYGRSSPLRFDGRIELLLRRLETYYAYYLYRASITSRPPHTALDKDPGLSRWRTGSPTPSQPTMVIALKPSGVVLAHAFL